MTDKSNDLQCEIVHNLNDIDKICSKGDFSSTNIELIYSKYIETITWIDDNMKSVDSEIAVQLIEFLKHFFDVISLAEAAG